MTASWERAERIGGDPASKPLPSPRPCVSLWRRFLARFLTEGASVESLPGPPISRSLQDPPTRLFVPLLPLDTSLPLPPISASLPGSSPELFAAMTEGGEFALEDVPHFNGGLFTGVAYFRAGAGRGISRLVSTSPKGRAKKPTA